MIRQQLAFFLVTFLTITSFAMQERVLKYTLPRSLVAFEIFFVPNTKSQYDFSLMVNLKEKTLSATFQEFTDERGKEIKATCDFESDLSSKQRLKLKELVTNVTYCKQRNTDDNSPEPAYLDSLVTHMRLPKTDDHVDQGVSIDKNFTPGVGITRYICDGGSELYEYLQNLIIELAPKSCPASYKMLFEY